jgi:hypothetical protein
MSKPIDRAGILKDACEFCVCYSMPHYGSKLNFKCGKRDLGDFDELCTREDWARCPFNPRNQKQPKPSPPQNYIADLEKLEFKNRGEFYYNANHYLHLLKKDVDPIIDGLNLDDPAERKDAWLKLIKDKPIKETAR